MTDIWQGGKTYVPGALVKPSSTTVVAQPQPTNGDFETGDLTGWAQGASRWTNTSTTPYAGTNWPVRSTRAPYNVEAPAVSRVLRSSRHTA